MSVKTHKLYTFEEWVTKCKKIHEDKYDYSETDFNQKDEQGRVKIFCKVLDYDGKPYGYFWQKPYDHMIGKNYSECSNNKKFTTSWFKEQVRLVYGDLYDTSKSVYTTKKNRVIVTCHKKDEFGEEYGDMEVLPLEFLKGKTFPDNIKRKYSTTFIKKKLEQIYHDDFDYTLVEYHGFRNKITLKCNKCGEIIEARLKTLLGGNFKCTNCSSSSETRLEMSLKKVLDKHNIEYEQYQKFSWLINKQQLSLDFFIPSKNIAIECQGRFHFEPYKEANQTDFDLQLTRDKLKYKLCNEHNIKLIYLTEEKFRKYQDTYFAELFFSPNEILKIIKQ